MFPVNATHKLLFVQKIKIQQTFQVALVIETVASVSITGKFETLGSNFSHETEGLLASAATIKQSLYHKRIPISIRP